MEHFIDSVRKYSCLWKLDTNDYKNTELREAAWRNIIVECRITDVKKAKSIWKTLRDGHRQALNKKRTITTGQIASTDDRLWKFEKQMDFLLPYLANRQKSTDDVDSAIQDIIKTEADEIIENFENTEENSESTTNDEWQQATYDVRRNKRKTDTITEYCDKKQQKRDQRSSDREELLKPKEDTALKLFFASMYSVTKYLPEYLQIKVQRQIFNSVMEAQEDILQKQSETPTPDFSS